MFAIEKSMREFDRLVTTQLQNRQMEGCTLNMLLLKATQLSRSSKQTIKIYGKIERRYSKYEIDDVCFLSQVLSGKANALFNIIEEESGKDISAEKINYDEKSLLEIAGFYDDSIGKYREMDRKERSNDLLIMQYLCSIKRSAFCRYQAGKGQETIKELWVRSKESKGKQSLENVAIYEAIACIYNMSGQKEHAIGFIKRAMKALQESRGSDSYQMAIDEYKLLLQPKAKIHAIELAQNHMKKANAKYSSDPTSAIMRLLKHHMPGTKDDS